MFVSVLNLWFIFSVRNRRNQCINPWDMNTTETHIDIMNADGGEPPDEKCNHQREGSLPGNCNDALRDCMFALSYCVQPMHSDGSPRFVGGGLAAFAPCLPKA